MTDDQQPPDAATLDKDIASEATEYSPPLASVSEPIRKSLSDWADSQ